MLAYSKRLGYNGGFVGINPKFDNLITSKSAVENGEDMLDKETTSYDDIFDVFRVVHSSWV